MSNELLRRMTASINFTAGPFMPGSVAAAPAASGPVRHAVALCLAGLLAMAALYPAARAATEGAGDAVLLPMLSGEFALQEGRHAEAAALYLQAATASADPALAERAARVALLADDDELASRALARWTALQPDADGIEPLRATLAVRTGNPVEAADALRTLLGAPGGWQQVARVLATQQDGLVTAALLSSLVDAKQFPRELEPILAFGGLALRHGNHGVAARLAERATAQHPESPRAWLWRAEFERRSGNADAARAALERARVLPGLDADLRMALAAQLDAVGDPAAAADVLAAGESTDALLAARVAYLARAEATPALQALYAELQVDPATLGDQRRYLLGQLAELLELDDAARDWYQAIAPGLHHDRAQLRLAVLHDRRDQLDRALTTLRGLQSSDSENGEVLIDAYLLEAELLRRAGRDDDAAATLDRGLNVFEDEPELLYARALTHERHGRVDAAVGDLQRLVALDPDNPNALNALGYTLADRTDRYNEALPLIQRALALDPDNAAILDSLGWVLHKLGRSSEALVYLRRSFALMRDAEVAAHLGEVLWLLGQRDEAREVWRAGGEIDGDNRALRAALERYAP